jgi:hypothetical protein
MPSIVTTVTRLTDDITAKRESLEATLFALQRWVEANGPLMTDADREEFSRVLMAEKDAPDPATGSTSDDTSLVSSVLRLHAMRLLFRLDASRAEPLSPEDATPYAAAKLRLKLALREVEMSTNEARIDAAIANAHHILGDRGANRRWLHDALIRLQTASAKDLLRLADAIPAPEPPRLSWLQKLMFRVLGIRQEEISRRTVESLRHISQMQNQQVAEMASLLAESFSAIGDKSGAQQALAILSQAKTPPPA